MESHEPSRGQGTGRKLPLPLPPFPWSRDSHEEVSGEFSELTLSSSEAGVVQVTPISPSQLF